MMSFVRRTWGMFAPRLLMAMPLMLLMTAGCQKSTIPDSSEVCDADLAQTGAAASTHVAPSGQDPAAVPAVNEDASEDANRSLASHEATSSAATTESPESSPETPETPADSPDSVTFQPDPAMTADVADDADDASSAPSPPSPPADAVEESSDATRPHAPANHLAGESSPYLKMHVHNPVDWYPWTETALKKARDEGKLIFLSVGYSSCYWCHVMERESFMDHEIAAFLNEHFVCIKVDREERPDVDSIYMMAVQLMTRRGGWPMSVFLTPDGQPFFGGTYFPARDGDRPGAPGFLTILQKIHGLWTSQPEMARETGAKVTEAIRTEMQGLTVSPDVALDPSLVEQLRQALARDFDPQQGGFGFDPNDSDRPKFPEASNLVFLLDQVERTGDEECRKMLLLTLDKMAEGGIWDHVGGGFHRYSTDRSWTIPHFEKMLYDNGQLLTVYARAYRLTQQEEYRLIVQQMAAWLEREMLQPGGGYAAALDAESEREEGKYYRWTQDELQATLANDVSRWSKVFAFGDGLPPNFEHKYVVLRLRGSWAEVAQAESQSVAELDQQLQAGRTRLLAVRDQRIRPLTDQKILCAWNGLVIRGLADAGRWTEQPEHLQAAANAADFVLKNLRSSDGRLLRTYSDGQAKLTAFLDDYAYFIDGLIGLHQATGDARWLKEADQLMKIQLASYQDPQQAGFFYTAMDHASPLVRAKLWSDEATPSANSVSATNLLYLAEQLQQPEYRVLAERLVIQATPMLQQYPRLAPRLVAAIPMLK